MKEQKEKIVLRMDPNLKKVYEGLAEMDGRSLEDFLLFTLKKSLPIMEARVYAANRATRTAATSKKPITEPEVS